MDELDGLLAERLRAELEGRGMRREDLARGMAVLGFRWTGNTVSQVINGRRGLSLLELAGVCAELGTSLVQLLGPDAKVSLPNSRSVTAAQIAEAINSGGGDWQMRATVYALFRQELDEATAKAAKRLGVEASAVDEAAQELWGRPLAAERDHRFDAADLDLESADGRRTLQARRGHATRTLVNELRSHFEARQ